MTWFKVDDSFHSHPKVLQADAAALGLWVVAGAWCSANLTDGFVPDYVLSRLLPDSERLAEMLITCRLWRRTKGGYRFHDWLTYQPTKEEATAAKENKSSGGVLGNHRRWHTEPGKQKPNCPFCQVKHPSDIRSVSDRYTETVTDSLPNPPTRPDPSREEQTPQPPVVVKRQRGSRIPDDFQVTEDMVAWARDRVPHIDGRVETEKFVNFWRAKTGKDATKLDWPATWRNWMLNANGRAPLRALPSRHAGGGFDFEREMARVSGREVAAS